MQELRHHGPFDSRVSGVQTQRQRSGCLWHSPYGAAGLVKSSAAGMLPCHV